MNFVYRPLLFAGLLLPAWAAWAEDSIPPAWPSARYEVLSRRSPFAVASANAAPIADQASFASNWYVSGIARVGDVDFVTIQSRDATVQFSLFGREPNTLHGVVLAGVTWADALVKSTVLIRKGNEIARLEFNEAATRGPAAVAQAPLRQVGAAPVVATTVQPEAEDPAPTFVPTALAAMRRRNELRRQGR